MWHGRDIWTLAYGQWMPKKYREVRAALRDAGWEPIRQTGSHEVWAHGDRSERIVVAGKNSATVPPGTLGSIRRASGTRGSAMNEYVVIYEQAKDGGWGAYLPDLPGVVALGGTRAEVATGIRDALSAYADDLRGRGLELPAPHHASETVAA